MKRVNYTFLAIITLFSCVNEVAIPVKVDFITEIVNQDNTVPVEIKINNKTEGADTYNWTFEGGNPATSTDKNPGIITYEEAGTYKIVLEASNRDDSTDSKEFKIEVKPSINVGFDVQVIDNNFSPVEVVITNTTTGATSYKWTFEGGVPASVTKKDPENVVFTTPGMHKITLEVTNGQEVHTAEKSIEVNPLLVADFDYKVPFEDDDFQVPVKLNLENKSISATSYEWKFEGADITSSILENPEILFTTAGTYKIELKAKNSKKEATIVKTINLLDNTNIRILENIKLGINTAHKTNTIGAYFSTITREVYTQEEVTSEIGSKIDIAFFGLNKEFTFNKFVSPIEVSSVALQSIPNATHTKFINSQESCSCGVAISVNDFDTMVDDSLLKTLVVNETTQGIKEFDDSVLPRIVVFETADKRKGVIKIKEFKEIDETNSYILIDVKVQKETE